ncbi:MAG: 4Fe-4S dicluster domain-containing protein, partial [Candidatus Thorarchaeota archaeon]
CVGSRNEQVGNEYCTGVCCMFGIKNASIIKEHLPDSEVYLCYIDIRTPGLYYEEYYRRAQKMGVRFVRGRPAEILPQSDGSLRVVVEDTLRNQPMEINADLVVLSAGMVATPGVGRLGGILGLLRTKEGFARDFHIKMGPVRSSKDGIYLAGTVQGPKDITQTVAHAGGAASAAVQPVLKGYLERRLDTAFITPEKCINCLACIAVCRAGAIQVREEGSSPIIVDTACQSCGICVPVCPTSAIQLRNFTEEQILAETRELLSSASLGSDAQ